MDKCPNYQNNGYFDARLKKKRKKIAHTLWQEVLQSHKSRKTNLSRSIVELG
jgi:hypothetical protein